MKYRSEIVLVYMDLFDLVFFQTTVSELQS
jgi:hypothetical protein